MIGSKIKRNKVLELGTDNFGGGLVINDEFSFYD